MTKSGYYNK